MKRILVVFLVLLTGAAFASETDSVKVEKKKKEFNIGSLLSAKAVAHMKKG